MAQPDVVIIFIPRSGDANAIGVTRVGSEWKYSIPVFIPVNEVQPFIQAELVSRGMLVFDCREAARRQNPGMEAAVPIIVYQPSVGLRAAVEAEAILHKTILEAE